MASESYSQVRRELTKRIGLARKRKALFSRRILGVIAAQLLRPDPLPQGRPSGLESGRG